METEKLYTIIKELLIYPVAFHMNSTIIPQELALDLTTKVSVEYHPFSFAYFLSFLCCFHLQDITPCRHHLQNLYTISYNAIESLTGNVMDTSIFCGITHQLIGETSIAIYIFKLTAQYDEYKLTSVATRLWRLT